MTQERLLIVEDERAQREALERFLLRRGYAIDAVGSGEEAMDLLRHHAYSVVITDLRLPGMDGLEVTRRAREIDEEIGVLLSTAYASVESAVDALRIGAHDYLLKPLILDEVGRKVASLLAMRDLVRENVTLRRVLHDAGGAHELVAVSAAMRSVAEWSRRAAASDANVLILGETGTGKEVVARTIHRLGPRPTEPFFPVNLTALPAAMVESELFGHEKGAFTGAHVRRDGILRAAGQGTVFLDEIGELPLPVQAKLLRALEMREVRPVGSDRNIGIEARVLTATHRDLKAMVASGAFREDLYYRLNVVVIEIPPLRERPEDIPTLARALLERHTRRLTRSDRPGVPAVTAEAMRALCAYPWPGNVRELSNVLERSLILIDHGRIDVEHLPGDISGAGNMELHLAAAVERFERSHIAMVLRLCNGNREAAAEQLGVSPATLYRRLERLQMKGFAVQRSSV